MNTWSNTVLTDKGLALMAKLTQGNTLNITKAMTGAGFVTPGVLVKQTEITDPKQSLSFRPASYPETGTCAIAVVLRNEGLAAGYEATQVGLFAEDPDEGEILFFITQAAEEGNGTTIPSETEMPGYSAEWTFYFKYGQASGVNIVVDPSNAVTQAIMEAYVHTTFKEMKTDLNMAGHKITDVAEPTQGSDVATRNFVEQHTLEGNLYIAVDYNNDGNIVLKPYVADDDVETLHTHLKNQDNPHGVTIEQIGAAPAGYGLGGYPAEYIGSVAELDTRFKYGLYMFGAQTTNICNVLFQYATLLVYPFNNDICVQELRPVMASPDQMNVVFRRYCYGGSFSEWEIENPPMALGTEYRTTERWNGEPLYTKLVNIGAIPNTDSKYVTDILPMNIKPLSISGIARGGTNNTHGLPLPTRHIHVSVDGEWGSVYVSSDSDYSNYTGFLIVKYAKN